MAMANNIVEFNYLKPQWEAIKNEVNAGLEKLYETSDFILGPPVSKFERNFAVWNHSKYAIGVSNATDGLEIAARAFQLEGKKTAVFIPANTFIATFIGINKAIPNADYFLVDCDEYFQINVSILEIQLAKHASSYEEIIVAPVHLFGCTSDMNRILELQTKFGFKLKIVHKPMVPLVLQIILLEVMEKLEFFLCILAKTLVLWEMQEY
jgi:dTDP-4-amino-4,6-dideoxygalactose transaminase